MTGAANADDEACISVGGAITPWQQMVSLQNDTGNAGLTTAVPGMPENAPAVPYYHNGAGKDLYFIFDDGRCALALEVKRCFPFESRVRHAMKYTK